jgi:hypothetical protein
VAVSDLCVCQCTVIELFVKRIELKCSDCYVCALVLGIVLLISDGPVSFYQRGNKADSYKILSLLHLAILFLPQFIPLVHHLLFLRMHNSDDSA